uniref:Short-chain dehydrogenase TIC 32, chloroplastic n=1 Tax=Ananas comosus var. bracteatus TaxID=296719 RepID=A0A6V7NS00_ANACO|nr:unnamed protein product [Ananas comosus var. bracteatus]
MLETVKYLMGSPGPSGYGSKTTAEDVTAAAAAACSDLRCITAIVTGATSGIGAETARVLAMRGARLVLPARSLKAAEETKARIAAEFPGAEVFVLPLDLSSLSSVHCFASRFLSLRLPSTSSYSDFEKKNVFCVRLQKQRRKVLVRSRLVGGRRRDDVRHKLSWAFFVDEAAAGDDGGDGAGERIEGRIVNVSSGIHGWFSGDMLRYLDMLTSKKIAYDATKAYALSKLANVLHTKALAERLKEMGANVTANCVHPGIVRTGLTRDHDGFITVKHYRKLTTPRRSSDLLFLLASRLLKTIPQAAATTCYVATHPALRGVSGKYFADCNEAAPSKSASDGQAASQLWRASEAMTAEKAAGRFPESHRNYKHGRSLQ